MKSLQDLAREAGAGQQGRHLIFNSSDLERFYTLAIEQEHKRLLEGSGETSIKSGEEIGDITFTLDHYTDDQMAAAVLREREAHKQDAVDAACFRFWVHEAWHSPADMARLLSKCETEQDYRDKIVPVMQASNAACAAAAIRGQR